ncbi:MAG: GreA/GreB family elongation factor [Chlamydiales bacterium]|nr:GreA/GreB family elongation factor [Chlamydiales bacterium]
MEYLKQFEKHIQNNDLPSFVTLWEEYCMGDEVDPSELQFILEAALKAPFAPGFGKYVEQILGLWEQIEDRESSHYILKLIFDLQTTDSETLMDLAINYLEKCFETEPRFVDNMKLIGLRDRTDCRGAISKYELLHHMNPGNFVYHTAGWGVGEIMDVSFLREQLSLEFDYVSGQKDFSFENAFKTLYPIPSTHFLAMRFGRPDYLENKAKEDPLEVIHMLLRDLGPKTASDIKDEMCELVIPQDEWVKWWQNVRTKLKKDTKIETPADSKSPFKIRRAALSHEDRFQKTLEDKPDAETLIQLVYAHMRDFPQTLKNFDFKQLLQTKLTEVLAYPEVSTAQKLQLHYYLQDLGDIKDYPPIQELIHSVSNIKNLIDQMDVIANKKRTLVMIQAYKPDWQAIFLDLFLSLETGSLREYILTELLAVSQTAAVEAKLEELLKDPIKYPQTVIWYFQKIMTKNTLPFNSAEGRSRFFEAFLILMGHLDSQGDRDAVKKMYAILTKGRFALVRKIMSESSQADVQEFLLLASKCPSIEEQDIKILHSLAEVAHPKLKKLRKNHHEEPALEIIWTTQKGLDKVKGRIDEIGSREMVENAKEIEEARSHGDLRENAEFKAACERRDRLQSELKTLSDKIAKTQVLNKTLVNTNEVSPGCVVECEDSSKNKVTFTLLGPWDADPEKNILSIQSRFAQEMMGKKVGESFEYQSNRYTVLTILNYFA